MTNRALIQSGDDCKGQLATLCPQLTAVSLNLPTDLPFPAWEQIGAALARVESSLQWYTGDWWVWAQESEISHNEMESVRGRLGYTSHTLYNYASVARAFSETSRRREKLSFSHHEAVTALDRDEADRLLDWCLDPAAKRRSVMDLRDEVRRAGETSTIRHFKFRVQHVTDVKLDLPYYVRKPGPAPAQPAEPQIELDTSIGGGPVPDELGSLQIEPSVQLDRVAIAWTAIAKLAPDEVSNWIAAASSEQIEDIRAKLEGLLARLRR